MEETTVAKTAFALIAYGAWAYLGLYLIFRFFVVAAVRWLRRASGDR